MNESAIMACWQKNNKKLVNIPIGIVLTWLWPMNCLFQWNVAFITILLQMEELLTKTKKKYNIILNLWLFLTCYCYAIFWRWYFVILFFFSGYL